MLRLANGSRHVVRSPTPSAPGMQWPWALRITLLLGLLVWIFAIIGVRSLLGQVTAVAEIRNGVGEIFVGNPSKSPLAITVQLYRDATTDSSAVVLGPLVSALVSPATFTLQAGESQIVRVRLREPVAPGELLRVVTILDPRVVVDTTPGLQVTVVTRLITKARVVQ